eukprot:scaffold57526_cov31-Attheya_sp.AAC.1
MGTTAKMGGTHNRWPHTLRSNSNGGHVFYKASDSPSINKASSSSWHNVVDLHIFPLVDWYNVPQRRTSFNML